MSTRIMTVPTIMLDSDEYLAEIAATAREGALTTDSRVKAECVRLLFRQVERLGRLSMACWESSRKPVARVHGHMGVRAAG